MTNLLEDMLHILTQYFAYIYPGIITIFIYNFIRGRKIEKNKLTFLEGIVISYIYLTLINVVLKVKIEELKPWNHIIIIVISIIVPICANIIVNTKWFIGILRKLKINTEVYDNVLDLIKSKECDPEKGIVFKVLLDDKGLMYEGKLREHESEVDKEQIICLSGYRRYVKVNDKFEKKLDYGNDNSRWVVLRAKEINRIEVKYEDKK